MERARARLEPSLRRVLNATGVVVHTNLGRAPLARGGARGGGAGRRWLQQPRVRPARGRAAARATCTSQELLCELTGAEAALGGQQLRGRGAARGGGARRARARADRLARSADRDRRAASASPRSSRRRARAWSRSGPPTARAWPTTPRAIRERTGAILRAHPSNFRALGFVEERRDRGRCAALRRARHRRRRLGRAGRRARAAGRRAARAPLGRAPARRSSCFSGDKLLGGPQAGLIVGPRRRRRQPRARHPLARAVRIDKLSLAALEATLALYRDPELARREIPVLAMLDARPRSLDGRAERARAGDRRRGRRRASRASAGARCPLLELRGPAVALDRGTGRRRCAGRGRCAREIRR